MYKGTAHRTGHIVHERFGKNLVRLSRKLEVFREAMGTVNPIFRGNYDLPQAVLEIPENALCPILLFLAVRVSSITGTCAEEVLDWFPYGSCAAA